MELGTLLRQLNEGQNDTKSRYSVILIPGPGGCDFGYVAHGAGGATGSSGRRDCGARTRNTLLIEPIVATADDYVFAATLGRDAAAAARLDEREKKRGGPLSAPLAPLALDDLRRPSESVVLRDVHGALESSPRIRERLENGLLVYDSNNANDTIRSVARPAVIERRTASPTAESEPPILPTAPPAMIQSVGQPSESAIPTMMDAAVMTTTTTTTTMATTSDESKPTNDPTLEQSVDALLELPLPYDLSFRSEPLSSGLNSLLESGRGLVNDLFRGLSSNDRGGGIICGLVPRSTSPNAEISDDYDINGKLTPLESERDP